MSSRPAGDDGGLVEQVRRHYARAATSDRPREAEADLCGADGSGRFGAQLYSDVDRQPLPQAAVAASLGCGNPTMVADLRPGDTVLDLGSGAGIDLVLSARRVGSAGKVYGLDMTEEMLAAARTNLREAGVTNVELLKGVMESIPLPAATVDVVISNCVLALSSDKPAVFAEMLRVLRPGGRVGIADVVADDEVDRTRPGAAGACIAGALSVGEYHHLLEQAGFGEVAVTVTHDIADGLQAAIVQATRPPSRR